MLASWDKLQWALLHPQEFQIILVYSKKGFRVFTGPSWVIMFLFRPPLFLCNASGCVAFPRACTCLKNESPNTSPSHWPTHCAWVQPALSRTTTVERDPRLLPLPKQQHLLIFGLSVMLQIYSHHSAGFMSQTPAAWPATTCYLLRVYLVWGRFFLEGKTEKLLSCWTLVHSLLHKAT